MSCVVILRLVCATRPHTQKVVGIGFQPGLDPAKVYITPFVLRAHLENTLSALNIEILVPFGYFNSVFIYGKVKCTYFTYFLSDDQCSSVRRHSVS